MLHRADSGHVSGKHEYEKIIDKNDSKKKGECGRTTE